MQMQSHKHLTSVSILKCIHTHADINPAKVVRDRQHGKVQ